MRLPDAVSLKASLLVLIGAALLAGRLALAVHPYEHDAGLPEPDCEQCEFAQGGADAPAPDRYLAPEVPVGGPSALMRSSPVRSSPRHAYLPRAPPLIT